MADSKRERRGHFRGKPRPGRRVEVRYRLLERGAPGSEQLAVTKNIGVGGAFVLTSSPPPPGTELKLELRVPNARPIEVDAEVRWIVDGTAAQPGREAGMGLKFNALEVEQLLALNEYFATLTDTLDHDEASREK